MSPPGTPWVATMYSEHTVWIGTPVISVLFSTWLGVLIVWHFIAANWRLENALVARLRSTRACAACGYDITGVPRCPECGRASPSDVSGIAEAVAQHAAHRVLRRVTVAVGIVVVTAVTLMPGWGGAALHSWMSNRPEIPSGWLPFERLNAPGRLFLSWSVDACKTPSPLWK